MAEPTLTDWLSLIVNSGYTIITFGMFYVVSRQMYANERPYVSILIEQPDEWDKIFLVLYNGGKSSATNLKLTIDGCSIIKIIKTHQRGGEQYDEEKVIDLNKVYPFNAIIPSLPSGAETKIAILDSFDLRGKSYKDIKDSKFKICVSYKYGSKQIYEKHDIDLTLVTNAQTSLNPIARELSGISQEIKEIKSLFERISSKPYR